MRARLPGQNKKQREGLALLTATMLDVRSANLMDLAASLPRAAGRLDMRYQWISRLLGDALIEVDAVMAPHGREVLARLAEGGRRIVLMIDQTRATERHQVVMVAARVGGRALPLAWRVKAAEGAIGFPEQRAALEAAAALLPAGARPVLMGDRFYGTPDLIAWCRARGWGWRLRLKRDLLVFEAGGGETSLGGMLRAGRAPAERRRAHREAGSDQRRHGPRGGPPRALDHRPVRGPDRPPRLRLRAQVGDRGHAQRLQDARLRPGGQPPPPPRAPGPPHPRHGPVLGGLGRHVGRRLRSDAGRRKAPGSATPQPP